MSFIFFWYPVFWYLLSFVTFFFLFNIKFWLNCSMVFNMFSLSNYYFYFFSLKIIQQYHIFLKISYFLFFIISICYFLTVYYGRIFYYSKIINYRIFYWFNIFFYLYIFIGVMWTFIEPSWINWWLNENIEELILCIIFFYFISYIHFCQIYYRLWFYAVIYFFCIFYWVEQHNILFNSRHLKILFYLNIINISAILFFKKFINWNIYQRSNTNNFFYLWDKNTILISYINTNPTTKHSGLVLNYYFYLFNLIVYFNILLFVLPTFLNFWQINFIFDSYYYDLVYSWVLLYLSNYNFFKLTSILILIDSIFLVILMNKVNLIDYIHIILFFTLLINFSLVYWDSYYILFVTESLHYNLISFSNTVSNNFYLLQECNFIYYTFVSLKYIQILEYLFILFLINTFITKNGVRGSSFTAILS